MQGHALGDDLAHRHPRIRRRAGVQSRLRIGVIRLAVPSTAAIPPLGDWLGDLVDLTAGYGHRLPIHG